MRIIFIDHEFHRKTRSSAFFCELLERFFEVQICYVDPDSDETPRLPDADPQRDIVVIWQMDYLAPIFIAMGCRVVVIPMYDGSSTLPDIHWLWSTQARFINFSRRLHAAISRTGAESLLVKYFTEPRPGMRQRSFAKLNVLLWQRQPQHGINLGMVERLLGSQISRLHVHDSPDNRTIDSARWLERSIDSYHLRKSQWFKDPADYGALLHEHNVYIAPRLSEGIGMGFIEAMANGMLVIAADSATHDEYISNWVNGILINPADIGHAYVLDRARQIAQMAWKTCEIGHERWLQSINGIIRFISATPLPTLDGSLAKGRLTQGLVDSYRAGIPSYTSFLMNNAPAMQAIVKPSALARIRILANGAVAPKLVNRRTDHLHEAVSEVRDHYPWLDQNRYRAANPADSRYLSTQSVRVDAGCAWALGDGVSFFFSIDPRVGSTSNLQIGFRSRGGNQPVRYLVILNGHTLGEGELADPQGTRSHAIRPGVLARENILRIQALGPVTPDATGVRNAWGLTGLDFV